MLIDTHQHFWHYNREEYGWIDERMKILQRDYLPEELHGLMQSRHVTATVAVQARQSLEETEWLLHLSEKHPWIQGVVGWVDLRDEKSAVLLERYSQHPKFVGVRHVVQDEPDDNFLLREDFCRGISYLKQYNLTYDLLIFPRHLPVAQELVRRFPEQPFVVDHLAKPLIREKELSPWAEDMKELAQYPNVFCKISGMVTEADWTRWKPEDFTPAWKPF